MAGTRVVRCDLCRQRHKRCSHNLPQPPMSSRATTAASTRRRKSLMVKLPVKINFTGDQARLVRASQPAVPHPETHLSSHPVGPPPLRLRSLNREAVAEYTLSAPAAAIRSSSAVSRAERGLALDGRDVDMSLQARGTVPAESSATVSDRMQVDRGRADSVVMPQGPDLPGQKYSCDLCSKPILSEVWHSCRVCGNVDFHKSCVQEGRRIHHITYPKHGFMQVAREGQEEEELFAGWPAPIPKEDGPDVFICDACDQPVTGMRHYCVYCPELDFCNEHFVAGMKDHQSSKPNHIFDHQQVPNPLISDAAKNCGTRYARGIRINAPLGVDYPVDAQITRSDKLFSETSVGSPRRGRLLAGNDSPIRTASSPNGTTTPISLPRSRRESGKQPPPPSRRHAGKARNSTSAHDQPALNRPKADFSHFSSITEQLAQSTPPRPVRHRTYPCERTTTAAFAKKWLFHFHSYIRTWSEESNVSHAADGMQMVSDFTSDAALNDFMPAHFSHTIGVEIAMQNRDYHFTNPFEAASNAWQLNQRSVENWRVFRDRDGVIAGQVVATMGSVQLQEVDALLIRARELNRIDGWRPALPLLRHSAGPL